MLLSLILFSASACSDDDTSMDTGPADSSVDSTVGDTMVADSASDVGDTNPSDTTSDGEMPTLSDPPDAPAPPILTPCADGYREQTVSGVTVCEPWETGAPPACGAGEEAFPGGTGCTPIGTCPAGEWPEDLPADSDVVFVQASAGAGGTGTRAAPFRTVEEAIGAAETSQTIALAKGTYSEATMLRLPDGVSLVGACPLETRIESSASVGIEVIFPTGTIRGLSVTSMNLGIVVAVNVVVTIEDVIVEDVARHGILVGGGVANMERVVVRRTGENGMLLTSDLEMRLSTVVVRDASDAGIRFQGSGESTLDGVAVLNAGDGGAINVNTHEVIGESVVIDGTTGVGIEVLDSGRIELEGVVVRRADRGVHARMGGTAEITRGWLANNRGTGMSALAGGTLSLTHSVVSDTAAATLVGVAGVGVRASNASLNNVLLSQNTGAGLLVYEAGATATFADLTIDAGATPGRGLNAEDSGIILGDRVSIVGCSPGVFAHGADSVIGTDHVLVDGATGIGIVSTESGAVSIDRLGVVSSGAAGVQVAASGGMDLTNGEIIGNPIGANVRVEGFDTSRIQTSVMYRDNGVDLDMSELTTPDPLLP